MLNIFILSKNILYQNTLTQSGHNLRFAYEFAQNLLESIEEFNPDIVILDEDFENKDFILGTLLTKNAAENFVILYLVSKTKDNFDAKTGFLKRILKPVSEECLQNEINFAYFFLKTVRNLHSENKELKKNLYQIDTFYNASSKFAGTLEKEKLYEVMFETFERILSFDMAAALIKDDFEKDNIKFYINSLKKTTENLNGALVKRLSICAKDKNLNGLKISKNRIQTIQKVKPSYKNEFFDLNVMEFDTLSAPIAIKGKFEGVIELFRKSPFTKEDVTCFQSIVHQVLAPLRSAVLYDEIMNANVKLKNLERMKSEFVSIVSHELRTPLTPINNALEIILSEEAGKIGDVNKNFANIAKRNVSRLSGIIEDLLDLSRMQTGKFEFSFKKTSIYPSLELAYSTFKNQAQAKNIEFEYKADDNLKEVYADCHRIDQIISNLITNAIKFTCGGGKICLEASMADFSSFNKENFVAPYEKNPVNGEYIKISVKDTGVGIEKEDIPKIFDKFSQIENSLARNSGGIGLGLTITKHFIDAHLGFILVESKKNEGSAFEVLIPVYSENTEFEIELNHKIKTEAHLGLIEIEEDKSGEFYAELKNENIIKPSKHSKELIHFENNKKISKIYITELEEGAFDFMVSKIKEKINSKGKNCDIVLKESYYKKEKF